MVSLDMGLSVSKLDSILTHQRLFLVGSRESVRFFRSLELLEIYICQHSLVRFVFFSETHYIITESMSKTSKICRKFGSFEVVLHPNERHVQDSWYHRKGFFIQTPCIRSRGSKGWFHPGPKSFEMDPNSFGLEISHPWESPGCFQKQSRGWGGRIQCPSVFHHPSRCTLNWKSGWNFYEINFIQF